MLFNFAFSSYRQRVISKHQTLVFTCVSITDNLKLTTTFLTMKTLIWKFQILIHSNNFKISIFFSHILVMFSEKIWLNFLKMNSLNCFKNPCRKSQYFINVTQTLTYNFIRSRLSHTNFSDIRTDLSGCSNSYSNRQINVPYQRQRNNNKL